MFAKYFLLLLCLGCAVFAGSIYLGATTIMIQIFAALIFIVAAIFLSAALIIDAIIHKKSL